MTPPKKKVVPLSDFAQLARNARVGPSVAGKKFNVWSTAAKEKLASFIKQKSMEFGGFDSDCQDLVIGLVLLDKEEKEIIDILKSKFGNIAAEVFQYTFKEELKFGRSVADALVTNAVYRRAILGNVPAIKLLGIKMGWFEVEDEGDEKEIKEIMNIIVNNK